MAIAFFAVAVSSAAHAITYDLGLGASYTYFTYKELLTAPAKSTETVLFSSLTAEARLRFENESFFQLRTDICAWAESQYDGASLPSDTDPNVSPVQTVDPMGFFTVELTYQFPILRNWFVYAGYGYRLWNRFLSGGNGYREIYSSYYAPIGTRVWFLKDSGPLDLGVDVSVRPTMGGTIDVITSETYSNGQDSQMNLGAKIGYRASIPVRWKFEDPSWALEGSLWYEHSEIGQSNLVANATLASQKGTGILEPNSKTEQFGLEAMALYRF